MTDHEWSMSVYFVDAWSYLGTFHPSPQPHMAVEAYIGLDERGIIAYAAMERVEPIE